MHRSSLKYIAIAIIIALSSCTKDETADHFYFRNNGADMKIVVEGNQESRVFILLLHGGPGGSGTIYNSGDYSKILEDKYAMVYYDQRGQGASQGKYSKEDITIQQMANDTEALLKMLKLKYGNDISLFMMGHSWGGTLGTATLVDTDEAQAIIKGWIEVGGAHDIPLLNKEVTKMLITIGQQQIALGKRVSDWQPMVDFALSLDTNNITNDQGGELNSFGHKAAGLLEEVTAGGGFSTSVYSPNNIIGSVFSNLYTSNTIFDEVERFAYTDRLDEITLPTLMLWGRYDFVVPPALMETGYDQLGSTNKEKVYFDHSGHSPMDNEPELFAAEVIDFVEAYK